MSELTGAFLSSRFFGLFYFWRGVFLAGLLELNYLNDYPNTMDKSV